MPRLSDYEKKQKRKAYALFYIRSHNETAHKARRAYRFGLFLMLAMLVGINLYAWHTGAKALTPVLACTDVILILALLVS